MAGSRLPLIVTCGCGDTDAFAKDAFKILFPGQPLPPVVSYEAWNGEFGRWSGMVKAGEKSREKYAYYISEDEIWDLLKGVRRA